MFFMTGFAFVWKNKSPMNWGQVNPSPQAQFGSECFSSFITYAMSAVTMMATLYLSTKPPNQLSKYGKLMFVMAALAWLGSVELHQFQFVNKMTMRHRQAMRQQQELLLKRQQLLQQQQAMAMKNLKK